MRKDKERTDDSVDRSKRDAADLVYRGAISNPGREHDRGGVGIQKKKEVTKVNRQRDVQF